MIRIVEANTETWNNYHTHTYRCGHAEGDIGDYAKRAAELGMAKLGFSDHAFIPGEENPYRMAKKDIPGYVDLCRRLDGKYGVKILCGVECDYDPSDEKCFQEYYLEELKLDYIVGSIHGMKGRLDLMDAFSDKPFGVSELRIYTDLYVKMIESGIFAFCAHPDLFGRTIEVGEGAKGWDRDVESAAKEIVDAAAEHDTILEINTSGVWKTKARGYSNIIYPRYQFWEMAAEKNIRVIVNTDAHTVDQLDSGVDYGMELVRRYHLQRVELEIE